MSQDLHGPEVRAALSDVLAAWRRARPVLRRHRDMNDPRVYTAVPVREWAVGVLALARALAAERGQRELPLDATQMAVYKAVALMLQRHELQRSPSKPDKETND